MCLGLDIHRLEGRRVLQTGSDLCCFQSLLKHRVTAIETASVTAGLQEKQEKQELKQGKELE